MNISGYAYFLDEPNKPLKKRNFEISELEKNEVVIKVSACGLCHTDLSFFTGSVKTKKKLPMVLGHEISGQAIAAGDNYRTYLGKYAIIPAVLPCGTCDYCCSSRANACLNQKMPGNDIDGGFATHIRVPGNNLSWVHDSLIKDTKIETLSIVADAVSTAFRATERANVEKNDIAVIVGAGGVGGFVIQIAKALGANVLAIDVIDKKLQLMRNYGADYLINSDKASLEDIRKETKNIAKRLRLSGLRLKIFECSGTSDGQKLGFKLIERGSTYVQVGFTMNKVEIALSNIMAFDATIHGTWGCPPESYKSVLTLIAEKKIVLDPFVSHAPMSKINEFLEDMKNHKLSHRIVMNPQL